MVHGYAKHFRLEPRLTSWWPRLSNRATMRGSRSGRTAWQLIQALAGRLGKPIDAAGD